MSSSGGVQRLLRLSTMEGYFPFARRSVPPKVWAARSACLVTTLRFAFGPGREWANLIWSVRARLRMADAVRLSSFPIASLLSPKAAIDRSRRSSSGVHDGPVIIGTDSFLRLRQIDASLTKLQWPLGEPTSALGAVLR
jgi:hypothetical protein